MTASIVNLPFHVKPSREMRCGKCGTPIPRRSSGGYCKRCHAAYMRKRRALFACWWEAEGKAAFERWRAR